MPPSIFCPDTTWTGTQILLSEQHCALEAVFLVRCPASLRRQIEILGIDQVLRVLVGVALDVGFEQP